MTKKRFTILYETEENPMEWDLIDNQEDCLIVTGNGKAICDLLNELDSENKSLKQQLKSEHQMLDNAILLERTRMGQNSLKQYKEAIQ